jgi:NAD dependent epimerase/dehydratase family enzyme
MSWISLDDEVDALIQAAEDDALTGPCNATSPHPVRNSEFTAALGAALHRPAVMIVPRPLLELAAGRETTSEFLCASQRALPRALERAGFSFAHPELAGALEAIVGARPAA